MLLNLTDLSNEPLQSQIFRQIRAKILSGELAAGEMLPSIRALALQQQVSVVTVQRGYESLERADMIHSRRGKGFFMSEITQTDRKEIAMKGLIQKIEPLLRAALKEGITPPEILEAIRNILESKE